MQFPSRSTSNVGLWLMTITTITITDMIESTYLTDDRRSDITLAVQLTRIGQLQSLQNAHFTQSPFVDRHTVFFRERRDSACGSRDKFVFLHAYADSLTRRNRRADKQTGKYR